MAVSVASRGCDRGVAMAMAVTVVVAVAVVVAMAEAVAIVILEFNTLYGYIIFIYFLYFK